MIQFFIENQEVILPDDFSFTQIDENPLITNNGEFTLDITVSLRNGKNAKAAKFINRINKIDIETSYNALMIDDGVYKHGTIIIQSHTNADMTFQFVAGNSELNYLAKNDKKIWELDWGTETEIDYARALASLGQTGWSETGLFNFVCAPVQLGTTIPNLANDFDINLTAISGDIIMQPYILYYINRLPELLGYTLKTNILNADNRAKNMFLVNAVKSLNYGDLLPDMTVSEFITEVEVFFNVSLITDYRDKSISIIRLQDDIQNKKTVQLTNVLDEYIRDFSEDSKTARFDYTKVNYDLPSNDYFKYHCLSDDILKKSEIIGFHVPFFPSISDENKLKIFRNLDTEADYFAWHLYNDGSISPKIPLQTYAEGTTLMSLINKFSAYGTSDEKTLTLKLIPAAMYVKSFTVPALAGTTSSAYQMPQSSNEYFIPEESNFIDLVEKGDKEISRSDKLEVSLFWGNRNILKSKSMEGVDTLTPYPMSYNDTETEPIWYTGDAPYSLRLKGAGGVISDYQIQNVLDTSDEIVLQIPDSPDLDANNLFEYKNQNYMPISFERTKKRKKGLVKGTFYRML